MVIAIKKIICILVSLLFIGSTFGVASILSASKKDNPCECGYPYPCLCEGSSYGISMTTVKVGQTFTITHNKQETYWQWKQVDDSSRFGIWSELVTNGFPVRLGLVELIDFRAYYDDGSSCDYLEAYDRGIDGLNHTVYTFRAVRPGTVYFTFKCNPISASEPCSCCDRVVPVRITSKSYPMDWIIKKFGLGKYKE